MHSWLNNLYRPVAKILNTIHTYLNLVFLPIQELQTPLHIASRLGNVDIVVLLLQSGAQVDATTKDLYTALHIAAKEGQEEVNIVLLKTLTQSLFKSFD